MARSQATEEHGDRPVIDLIDQLALSDPERPYARVPRGTTLKEGYKTITVGQLSTAVNRAAWWLEEQLAEKKLPLGTFGYVGPHDLRYVALVLGAAKIGGLMFIPTIINSVEANIKLLDGLNCSTFLVPEGEKFHNIVNSLSQRRNLAQISVPGLDYFFDVSAKVVPHYPWNHDTETSRYISFAAMHSSGSTGFPKPIKVSFGVLMSWAAQLRLKGEKETTVTHFGGGHNCLVPAPFTHTSGLMLAVTSLALDYVLVIGPSGEPMCPDLVCSIIDECDVRVAMLPPAFVVAFNSTPKGKSYLSKLDAVISGGGPIPSKVGDQVCKLTNLFMAYGGTEFGAFMSVQHAPEDWEWFEFSETTGVDMRPYDDQVFECVWVRKAELKEYQGVFTQFPGLQEYATSDLWTPHPTRPGLWKYYGRTNDVILLTNGLKFNACTIENVVGGHPEVKGVIVAGMARSHSSLIIETVVQPDDERAAKDIIDSLWPTIELANEKVVDYGRVKRELVILATPGKPFARAGKGSIQRQMTVDSYQPELDALYDSVEGVA